MAEPLAAVFDTIAAAAVDGLTKSSTYLAPFDGNLIRAPSMDSAMGTPHGLCVFVVPSSGATNEPFLGVSTAHKVQNVGVVIRSNPQDFDGGWTTATAVFDAIHYAAVSGYYSVHCLEAAPVYAGIDEFDQHSWNFTVECRRVV